MGGRIPSALEIDNELPIEFLLGSFACLTRKVGCIVLVSGRLPGYKASATAFTYNIGNTFKEH